MNDSIVIIGHGNQAKAWSMNLRDSGLDIVIALRKNSKSIESVKQNGLKYISLDSDEITSYKQFVLLTPDHTHKEILKTYSSKFCDQAIIYLAHGISNLQNDFENTYPNFNFSLLAPKAIASELRFNYETKQNISAVVYSKKEFSQELNFLSRKLGITQNIESSFEEETYADLFSEQSLLCSLIPYGALHSFNQLIEKGISEEIAFIECWSEVKLISDAMIKHGPIGLINLISPNALIGGENAKDIFFDQNFKNKLKKISDNIWDQSFFEKCNEANYNKVKQEALSFWENQKLNDVYLRQKEKM